MRCLSPNFQATASSGDTAVAGATRISALLHGSPTSTPPLMETRDGKKVSRIL